MEYTKLYNGIKIPMLGFGVFQIPNYDNAKTSCINSTQSWLQID